MRKDITLPILALAGGAAGFLLRRWQLASAYLPETGLFLRGAPSTYALAGLFALLALFAWCNASFRRFFCSISLRVSSSTLQNPRTIPLFSAQLPALTTFIWKYSMFLSLEILKLM